MLAMIDDGIIAIKWFTFCNCVLLFTALKSYCQCAMYGSYVYLAQYIVCVWA